MKNKIIAKKILEAATKNPRQKRQKQSSVLSQPKRNQAAASILQAALTQNEEMDRAEKHRTETERAETERAEMERTERETAERGRVERETAERERAERERTERETAERETAERERTERETADRQTAERERASNSETAISVVAPAPPATILSIRVADFDDAILGILMSECGADCEEWPCE